MELIEAADEPAEGEEVKRLESSCRLIFGTEKVYIFMRLYCALIALFESVKTGMKSSQDKSDMDMDIDEKIRTRSVYPGFLAVLKDYINENILFKAYELRCRALTKHRCFELSAIPRLVEKCADALVKIAREDKILGLFDFYQLKHMSPVLQRTQSLDLHGDSGYRIQYSPDEGKIHFNYLARDKEMLTAPRKANIGGTEDREITSASNVDEPQTKRLKSM